MPRITLNILQGQDTPYPAADINIVIDVIRAFTVSHLAFSKGVDVIYLVHTVAEALALRTRHPGMLLAGEVDALPIDGFDLDNSPHTFSLAELAGKSLVQKTTNGVKATLLALNAKTVMVTGLSNARTTALHARRLAQDLARSSGDDATTCTINVIASHPDDDDDVAVAQYIRSIVLGQNDLLLAQVQQRISSSRPAQKFLDPAQPEFKSQDIPFCLQEAAPEFVMVVQSGQPLPKIVRQVALQPLAS